MDGAAIPLSIESASPLPVLTGTGIGRGRDNDNVCGGAPYRQPLYDFQLYLRFGEVLDGLERLSDFVLGQLVIKKFPLEESVVCG
jgi:hypothetical protein